ncbi:MAG: dihydrofolate reductase [Porticoccaceae bacterium]
MALVLIAAVARNGVIGAGNALPWHLPADLKRFKALTLGHPVVMGRKTFESIRRPLPGRANIVVSGDPAFAPAGVTLAASVPAALRHAAALGSPPVFVIGGAQIYAQCLTLADRIYLTRVDIEVAGDAFFPPLDDHHWREIACEHWPAADGHPAYAFVTLERQRD